MKSIKDFGFNVYSQNNEDGILEEVLNRIKPKNKTCVEFGGADGYFCSNTANLRDNKGWKSYMYDFNAVPGLVESKMITVDNINELPKCSVLSIDTDGPCYTLWDAYTGKPDVVIIEINSSLPPDEPFYSPEKGSSFCGMNALAAVKGYFLLAHTGNCLYILNKHKDKFPDADETFNTSWL